MNILEAPREVQDAVSQGRLTMILAEKVSRLTPVLKQQVADRIRKGERPNQAVREFVTQQRKPGKRSEERCKSVEMLKLIADLLDQVRLDTSLGDEDTTRSVDALTRCTNRCRLLTSQLKRPTMAADADAVNGRSDYPNLAPSDRP